MVKSASKGKMCLGYAQIGWINSIEAVYFYMFLFLGTFWYNFILHTYTQRVDNVERIY